MPSAANAAERWFRRVLWIGIVTNLVLAVPTLLWPAQMMALNRLPPATPLVWPRFASLLLVLLSLFYMPAGIDPNRYRASAWLAVAGRLAGVVFFLVFQAAAYRMLGYVDLVFFVPELILLIMVAATVPSTPGAAAAAASPAGVGALR